MTLVHLVLLLGVLFIVGLAAYWIIMKFFKDPTAQTIALAIVGIILLAVLLIAIFPDVGSYKVWGR